jgi:serine/threonine protein kinase
VNKFKLKKEDITNEQKLDVNASECTEIFTATYNGEVVISKKISFKGNSEHVLFRGRIKKREIVLMSELCTQGNQNIVKFHGWIEETNYIKIIMEYLQGSDLYSFVGENNQKLNEKQKVKILSDVAKGLDFLHKKNVIYRDLKSGNVMIDKKIIGDSLDFTAKIVDFGVSRKFSDKEETNDDEDEDQEQEQVTAKCGTSKYFAPEQVTTDYDYKVDIYSFAMMAFELFSEKICYTDRSTKNFNDASLMNKIRNQNLRPNKYVKALEGTPKEILEMCEKNLKLDPEERQTAEELVESIQEIYNNL